jgi:hypothetical protein
VIYADRERAVDCIRVQGSLLGDCRSVEICENRARMDPHMMYTVYSQEDFVFHFLRSAIMDTVGTIMTRVRLFPPKKVEP